MPEAQLHFAGYPTAFVFEQPNPKSGKVDQLLWGDYVGVTDKATDGFLPVKIRNKRTGWIAADKVEKKRLLEVVFVDIGQGDGCLVITPDDKFMIIDAGEGDNMARFLRWRFREKEPISFQYGILSHSDMDHYGGFNELFKTANFKFATLLTNGFMERFGAKEDHTLGVPVKNGKHKFVEDLVVDLKQLKGFLARPELYERVKNGRTSTKQYPGMLRTALQNGKFRDFRMLSAADGFLPEYEKGKELSMEVLGPVTEKGPNGKTALRWFNDVGKTKNGHSIVLKLTYRKLSMLLGGDLNIPSENLLLGHHTKLPAPPKTPADREKLIAAARKVFAVDIAKACHHGSADVSRDFLAAVNPLATIVSSGDAEPHSHPRPDALGAIGKNSRGDRPLIFSTELARSAPERIKHPNVMRNEIESLVKLIDEETNEKTKATLQRKLTEVLSEINRSVAVYGAINVRSDGERTLVAQMLEEAGPGGKKWDVYELTVGKDGKLEYVSKHD